MLPETSYSKINDRSYNQANFILTKFAFVKVRHILSTILSLPLCINYAGPCRSAAPCFIYRDLILLCLSYSRAMWFTEFVCEGVAARDLFPKVLFMGSPRIRVLLNWSFSGARGQSLRSELDGSWVASGSSILTGWMRFVTCYHIIFENETWLYISLVHLTQLLCYRTRHTNILRSFWWMLPTALSEMIQGSIGSATQFTNTGSCVASLLLGKPTGVYGAEDICTTKHVLPAGQPGRETTLFPFVVIVDFTCYFMLLHLMNTIWSALYVMFWLWILMSFERLYHLFLSGISLVVT